MIWEEDHLSIRKEKKNNANFNEKVLIALLSMKSWGIFFF
jgi:hypothetical protein